MHIVNCKGQGLLPHSHPYKTQLKKIDGISSQSYEGWEIVVGRAPDGDANIQCLGAH